MKYCPKCGKEAEDGARFCTQCGYDFSSLEKKEETKTYTGTFESHSKPRVHLEYRNIAVQIILCLVTCGIYSWYWQYKITEDCNTLSPNGEISSGGMAVLLTIVTCGLYGLYWAYQMGKKVSPDKDDKSVLYLILYLFAGIITYALLQSELNKYSNR